MSFNITLEKMIRKIQKKSTDIVIEERTIQVLGFLNGLNILDGSLHDAI